MSAEPIKQDRAWSEGELAYVADNLAKGYSYGQIAWGLKRSRSSVASAIRRMRNKDDNRAGRASSRSEASKLGRTKQVDLVAELMAEGFKFADIAEEMGVTLNAVKCAFKKIKKRLGAQAV